MADDNLLEDLDWLSDLAAHVDGPPIPRDQIAAIALLAAVEIRELRETLENGGDFTKPPSRKTG